MTLQSPAVSRTYSSAVQGKDVGRALSGLMWLELSLDCCAWSADGQTEPQSVGDLLMALWPEPPLARSPSAPRPMVTALSSQLSLDTPWTSLWTHLQDDHALCLLCTPFMTSSRLPTAGCTLPIPGRTSQEDTSQQAGCNDGHERVIIND